jgi:hypothetical protein
MPNCCVSGFEGRIHEQVLPSIRRLDGHLRRAQRGESVTGGSPPRSTLRSKHAVFVCLYDHYRVNSYYFVV